MSIEMEGKFSLVGYDAVIEKMRALPVAMRGKPGRSALGKAATIVRKAAQANAAKVDDPVTGRKISQNIVQRFRSKYFKRTGDLMISVGVATPKGRIPKGNPDEGAKGPTPHWHLIELGTEFTRAQPFLQPALANNINPVLNTFAVELEKQIDKITKANG